MGVEGGAAPRLQQVKSTESWFVVCNHSSLAPTTPPPSSWPSGKFTLCPHSLVALETRSPW